MAQLQHEFSRTACIVIALAIGVITALASWWRMQVINGIFGFDRQGNDFTYWWRAARALLAGQDPYLVINPTTASYPFDGFFAYPLPAAVATIPFAWLPVKIGAAVFVGCGFALLSYGLLRLGTWRLVAVLGAPTVIILGNGQWAPLLIGAALTPAFGWLLACKPTMGAALFLWRPSWTAFGGGIAICVVAFAFQPTWPLDWLAELHTDPVVARYVPPIAWPGGGVLALALLRWRRPEARLLALLSVVPQNALIYDQLPLLLVPDSPRRLVVYVAWTHMVRLASYRLEARSLYPFAADLHAARELAVFVGLFLPCLIMVLTRPNEGTTPAWIERALSRVPVWRRGQTSTKSAVG